MAIKGTGGVIEQPATTITLDTGGALDVGIVPADPSGTEWAQKNSGVTENLRSCWYADCKWVVVGDNGTILTSQDNGDSWQQQTSGVTTPLRTVKYWKGNWYVVGWGTGASTATVLKSADAITWTIIDIGGAASSLVDIGFNDTTMVFVGWYETGSGLTVDTTDGTSFTKRTVSGLTWGYGIHWSETLSKWGMVGSVNGTDEWFGVTTEITPINWTKHLLLSNAYPELYISSDSISLVNETNTIAGWLSSGLSSGGNTFESTSGGGLSPDNGTYHFKADGNATPTASQRFWKDLQSEFNFVNGQTYTITFSVAHNSVGGNWYARLSTTNSGQNNFLEIDNSITSSDTTYSSKEITFVYDDLLDFLVFGENNAGNDGGVFLDSLSIKRSNNLVSNGIFNIEQGSVIKWIEDLGAGDGTTTISNGTLKVTQGATDSNMGRYQKINVEIGKTYTLTGTIIAGGTPSWIGIHNSAGIPLSGDLDYGHISGNGTDTLDFTPTQTPVYVVAMDTDEAGTAEFDNISVYPRNKELWVIDNDDVNWMVGANPVEIYTSPDNIAWTNRKERQMNGDNPWRITHNSAVSLLCGGFSVGKIMRTVDNGENWELVYSNTNASLMSKAIYGPGYWLAVGWNGTIIKSRN